MRARKEHGGPLGKRNRSKVAYAMRVAVLLGEPSRRNARDEMDPIALRWTSAEPERQRYFD
jgi:hypothetical protein